ncbi:sulfatase-like hydrolase/transferase [Mesorhizobium sp.]|uniref:sulfatase family protein n=1 Tax=Mesorhizobium sp. TaxID=1871066 RepID=UPI000FE74B51|nr:sulfatase-like hydrolase/transferase [Mesorhizobium sp.]RWD29449.1 MAG: arylsulfatase [Mesorhizobium sp.]RWD85511.1 MAG: arylsulfatase [Mesorhizobium sp.]RWE70171.1 MAG: arylsulfatase [Mesorhizobium sp.]RWE98263.1 MAG: arylsulfatase [Mesorhizobium sp.]TIV01018.1 MAG: arylsulfatase [Mesorhizobium sp.]
MKRANIIFICADQMRYDALSVTGNRVAHTANIDSIAARGAIFHRHFTPNQICSPSRATMATGLYPRHHGLWRNGVALDERLPNLWQALSLAGYATKGVGKLHFQPLLAPVERDMPESLAYWESPGSESWSGPYFGFDAVDLVMGEANESTRAGHYAAWLKRNHPDVVDLYEPDASPDSRALDLNEVWKSAVPPELYYTSWIADRAIDFIERQGKQAEPFGLFVSFPDPHHPFAPPRPYCDLFRPERMPKPTIRAGELERMPAYLGEGDDPTKVPYIASGEQPREQGFLLRTDDISDETLATAIAHTHGMIQMIDDAVGRLIAALDGAGVLDDTYVLFTADHGELLGDHGLLRKGPPPYRQLLQVPLVLSGPGIRAGTSLDALTSHLDLFATIASLLGLPAPATDGIDLKPLIEGRVYNVRDFLFAEYHPRRDASLYNQSVISKEWRFTRYPNQPAWGELFDLREDAWEHWNLFSEQAFSAQLRALNAVLDQRLPPQPLIINEVLGAY